MSTILRVSLALLLGVAAAAAPAPPTAPGPLRSDVSDTLDDPETGILLDFTVHGGTVTQAEREGLDYLIRGTVRPGETISVAFSGNGTTFTPDHPYNDDVEGVAAIDFPGEDADVNAPLPVGESVTLSSSYVVPADLDTVEFGALVSNAFINPFGGGSRALVVRGELEVVADGHGSADDDPDVDEVAPRPSPSPTPDLACDDPSDAAPSTSSIVRFGDLYGEVDVRPNWEDDDAYIFAELSTPLQHCDRIRTLTRSGAILSFSDMSTFVMREDTTIVLDIANEQQSNLAHLAGVVWVNFNRMLEGRDLEIEMSQAIAGARGTTFICEETGETSTVRVIEGTVEVAPRAGAPVTVTGGQAVTVSAAGPGPVEPFDIEAEMAGWPPTAQQITADALAGTAVVDAEDAVTTSADPLAVVLLALGGGALAVGLIGLGVAGLRRAA